MQTHFFTNLNEVLKTNINTNDEALEILILADSQSLSFYSKIHLWFTSIESQYKRESQDSLRSNPLLTITLMQYNALLRLYQLHYFKHSTESNIEIRLIKLLVELRSYFTKTRSEISDISKQLPKSFLRTQSRESRLFHQTLFHKSSKNVFDSFKIITNDALFLKSDLFIFLLVIVFIIKYNSMQNLFMGLAFGYLFSSIIEFLVHRFIGHATPKNKKFLQLLGPIGKDMLNFNLEHSIHHGSVHQNYTNIFAPANLNSKIDFEKQKFNKLKVDQLVEKKGGEKLLTMVKNSNYGLSSSNIYRTQIFFFPVTVFTLFLLTLVISKLGFSINFLLYIGFLISSQLWILTSSSYHPYLHMTEDEVNLKAPWYWKIFLKTRLSRFIALSHRMHHVHGGTINQNLNIGFDFFHHWTPINLNELIEMKKSKVIF